MSSPELFKNLKLDSWYKALIYIGGVLLVLSLFLDVKGITNNQLQLLAGGSFLIGIGEWKNRKVLAWIEPPNAYTGPAGLMQTKIRQPDLLGIIFDIIGVVLIMMGIIAIIVH